MFDEGRKNSFNPDDFEEDEEFFFSDGNDYGEIGENTEFVGEEEFSSEDSKNENSDEDTDKEDNEGHAFMSEDEQPKFGDYSFDDSTESGFEEKADQADNHESSENASSYSDDSEEDASAENRDDAEDEGREIGIDLGTTNSVIAYIDKNGATKFVKVKNESLIPSFIFFKDKDTVYYGKKAKSYAKAMIQGAAVSLFKKHLITDSEKI